MFRLSKDGPGGKSAFDAAEERRKAQLACINKLVQFAMIVGFIRAAPYLIEKFDLNFL